MQIKFESVKLQRGAATECRPYKSLKFEHNYGLRRDV